MIKPLLLRPVALTLPISAYNPKEYLAYLIYLINCAFPGFGQSFSMS